MGWASVLSLDGTVRAYPGAYLGPLKPAICSDYHINVLYSDEDGGYIADISDLEGVLRFRRVSRGSARRGRIQTRQT